MSVAEALAEEEAAYPGWELKWVKKEKTEAEDDWAGKGEESLEAEAEEEEAPSTEVCAVHGRKRSMAAFEEKDGVLRCGWWDECKPSHREPSQKSGKSKGAGKSSYRHWHSTWSSETGYWTPKNKSRGTGKWW